MLLFFSAIALGGASNGRQNGMCGWIAEGVTLTYCDGAFKLSIDQPAWPAVPISFVNHDVSGAAEALVSTGNIPVTLKHNYASIEDWTANHPKPFPVTSKVIKSE